MKLVYLVGFIKTKFVTMHGHMNVKFVKEMLECHIYNDILFARPSVLTSAILMCPWTVSHIVQ